MSVLLSTSKFVLHTNYLEYFISNLVLGIFYLIIHIVSDQALSITLCEFSLFILFAFYESRVFYKLEFKFRSTFNILRNSVTVAEPEDRIDEAKPKCDLEEVIIGTTESLSVIENLIENATLENGSKLTQVMEHLNRVMKLFRSKNNIYSSDIEKITKGMDIEDRLFIQQTWSNQNNLQVRKPNKLRTLKTAEILNSKYDVQELIGILKQVGKM